MKSVFAFIVLAGLSTVALAGTPADHSAMGMSPHGSSATEAPLDQEGKVMSVVETKGFTYVEVKQASRTVWVAAPTVAVKKGETVRFAEGSIMSSYHSPSLNRTFSNVLFSRKIEIVKAK